MRRIDVSTTDCAICKDIAGRLDRGGPECVEDPIPWTSWCSRPTAAFTENFDDCGWEIPEIRDAGERVVVLTEMTGRNKGSGIPVRQRIGIVNSDFRDGMAGESHLFLAWEEEA